MYCIKRFFGKISVKIQYLGHASFRLISNMGTTVVCDPYDSAMAGLTMPRVRAEAAKRRIRQGHTDVIAAYAGNKAAVLIRSSELYLSRKRPF